MNRSDKVLGVGDKVQYIGSEAVLDQLRIPHTMYSYVFTTIGTIVHVKCTGTFQVEFDVMMVTPLTISLPWYFFKEAIAKQLTPIVDV